MSVPQKLYGFELQETREFKDSGYTGYLFKNEKFGCPFLYIQTEDTNSFFSVHIRTPEEDNTGISHMLEHLSLHGSEKYPIRGVFFELSKRSYSNFMNAFTTSEYTAFPFSSTNQTDFLNALDVYLDCVYHPKLSEVSFLSECHHLYFEDGDPTKPLVHGGVVYNEVAGAYSKQDTVYYQKLIENLYPDSPTRFDCGGTPDDIPKATYESLVNHHRRYYHPVNSFFYFYGNTEFPIDTVFKKVWEVINPFEIIESPYHPELYDMKPWTEPRTVTIDAPSDEESMVENQHKMTISYVINEKCTNDKLMCDLDFLVSMLGESKNSQLYQALVVPGHVSSVTMSFDFDRLYPLISITASGFLKGKASEIENIILNVLKNFSEENSEEADNELFERIDCYYHNIKIINKKVPDNNGLSLFHDFAEQWIHGTSPLLMIDYDSNLESSFSRTKQRGYLRSIAKRFLVENNHRLVTLLNSVPGFNDAKIEEEKRRLNELKSSLSPSEIDEILQNMKKIDEAQSIEQPINLLPQIHRSDLSKISDIKKADYVCQNGLIDVFINPTKGAVYCDIVVSVQKVDLPNLFLIPFVNMACSQIGAGKFDEFEMSKYVSRWLSSLDSDISILDDVEGKKYVCLTISSSCLNEDIEKLSEIMGMVLTEAHWNNKKQIEILVNHTKCVLSTLKIQLMESYNATRAGSILNNETALDESINGLTGHKKLDDFLRTKSIQNISVACERLYKRILTNGQIHGYISCSEDMKEKSVSAIYGVIEKVRSIPKIDYKPVDYLTEVFNSIKSRKTFINLPVQMGTVALSKFCVKVDQIKESVCLAILATILQNEAVLDIIRGKLGAYSASASFHPRTGIFTIWTARDGVPQKSYEEIIQILKSVENYINDETVERAVVSSLSIIDRPLPPPTKGMSQAIANVTPEYLQKRRDVFLSATADDVRKAAKFITEGEFNVSISANLNVSKPPEGFDVIEI